MKIFSVIFALHLTCGLVQAAIPKTPVVMVKPAQRTELFDVLSYPARLVPQINATVLAESDGVVSQILTPLGQSVKRGQKLFVIRHTDPVYQYAPVVIRAPVSGIVSAVKVTEGARVTRGEKLAAITDPSRNRIVVEIAGSDIPFVSKGLGGEFRVDGTDKPLSATVLGVSPFVDPATGTATCELEFKGVLSPGTVGRVSFKINSRKGFSIPDQAVVYKGDETFVRVVSEGKARRVPIALGKKQSGFVEVTKGLNEGDQIIERSSGFVADGEQVTVEGDDKT